MKRVALFVSVCILAFSVGYKPPVGFKKTYRYFKINCSTSNKTCIKPFCYIKNSRNDSTYSAGCEITRNVTTAFVGFSCLYIIVLPY